MWRFWREKKKAKACIFLDSPRLKNRQSGGLTAVAALLLAEQLRGEFLQVDSALSQVGLHPLQVVLSLVSAGHGPPDLHPALLQLLLLMPQFALIWGPRPKAKWDLNVPTGGLWSIKMRVAQVLTLFSEFCESLFDEFRGPFQLLCEFISLFINQMQFCLELWDAAANKEDRRWRRNYTVEQIDKEWKWLRGNRMSSIFPRNVPLAVFCCQLLYLNLIEHHRTWFLSFFLTHAQI